MDYTELLRKKEERVGKEFDKLLKTYGLLEFFAPGNLLEVTETFTMESGPIPVGTFLLVISNKVQWLNSSTPIFVVGILTHKERVEYGDIDEPGIRLNRWPRLLKLVSRGSGGQAI